MKNKSLLLILVFFVHVSPALADTNPPALILQITIDQLRSDMPDKFIRNMGTGGFRYLMENGIWYANASYGYTNTETAVGHTTLATGADPAEHGIIANAWFDRATGKRRYSIEDNRYHTLAGNTGIQASAANSLQKLATTTGRSPASILVSTFSDELAQATHGKAKIYAISIKDRAAVTLAGHSGKAFWFSTDTGYFNTSSYYYKRNPDFLNRWNELHTSLTYAGTSWNLLQKEPRYIYTDDDNPWEMDIPGFGRTFPHPYGAANSERYFKFLTYSPAGDELTLDFAKTIINAEKLGQDDVPDFLSISFSSTDYVGHAFGPSSLEAEDNMLRLDRILSKLFSYIDATVGLQNTLIVLSSDHGAPDAHGYLKSYGIDAGEVSLGKLEQMPSIKALKRKLGIEQQLILSFSPPYIYLNQQTILQNDLKPGKVEQAVADALEKVNGVAYAISSSALRENRLPDTHINRAALRNYNRERSGDILLIYKPNYFISQAGRVKLTIKHGSPWNYDTHVPIVFAGGKLNAQRIYREVDPADIAPTLASILRIKLPSAARGVPLQEVMHFF